MRVCIAPRRYLLLASLLVLLCPTLAAPPQATATSSYVFRVTSTLDLPDSSPGDGVCASALTVCTLRAATQEADALPTGSVISISVPAGVYALPFGQLILNKNTITVQGAGASRTILKGQGSRIMETGSPAITLNGLTLYNGNAGATANGGGVLNVGVLALSNMQVVSNTAFSGGGIANNPGAIVYIQNSSVVSNSIIVPNPVTFLSCSNETCSGGGIFNQGQMALMRVP